MTRLDVAGESWAVSVMHHGGQTHTLAVGGARAGMYTEESAQLVDTEALTIGYESMGARPVLLSGEEDAEAIGAVAAAMSTASRSRR